jgi:2-polyprenyl-6-methoxyphenol hydroxylase-like FAD-dependent oxidoreductase
VRALICGAGIAGLTLARLLSQQGWSVSLAERAGGLRPEGYMIDFFGPGFDAAEAIGLLPRLQQLAYQVSEVSYVDRNGRSRAALDYGRIARSLDGRLLSLLRGDLALALHEGLGSGVEMRYNTSVRTIEETADGVHATLTDGSRWRGDLLVGADGIHSVVRSLTFGPESEYLRFLGFHTAAYTFSDPDLHRLLARSIRDHRLPQQCDRRLWPSRPPDRSVRRAPDSRVRPSRRAAGDYPCQLRGSGLDRARRTRALPHI